MPPNDNQLRLLQQIRQRRLRAQCRARGKKKSVHVSFFDLPDTVFLQNFRFSKDSVRTLANLVRPKCDRMNNRGSPLSVENQVCCALFQLGGGCFNRVTALAAGISTSCARSATVRVVKALFFLRKDFINFPTPESKMDTANAMLDQFGIDNLFAGIDGCQIRFEEKPRGLPANHPAQKYWCRKQFYSLNTLFVSNNVFFYYVDCGWFGSAHDARVWNTTKVRPLVENPAITGNYKLVGDSAYPLSPTLIKPFDVAQNADERRFNNALSGARTLMMECLYGRLKRRFPILKQLRSHLKYSKRIIVVCCILHNFGEFLKDSGPPPSDDFDDEEYRTMPLEFNQHGTGAQRQSDRQRLQAGKVARKQTFEAYLAWRNSRLF